MPNITIIDSRTTNGSLTMSDRVDAAGKYFVRVADSAIGTYNGSDFHFVAHVESADTISAATALSAGTALQGTVSSAGQHNWYKLSLEAGHLYEFSAAGSAVGGGTLATPSLSLSTFDGKLLENSTTVSTYIGDTQTYLSDAKIAFVAGYTGTYYLMADGMENSGTYTVQQQDDTLSAMMPGMIRAPGGACLHWAPDANGTTTTVTFGFMNTSSFATNDGQSSFKAMSTTQQQAVRNALDLYSQVANITYKEVSDPLSAQILFGTSDQKSDSGGITFNDWNADGSLTTSDVYINNTASSSPGTAPADSMTAGDFGYLTLIHEIGHALGLKHPGDYNGVSGSGEAPFLPAAWDSMTHSLMSYLYDADHEVYAQAPALLDIAAVQYLYGARTSTVSKVIGGAGNDYIIGNSSNDTISGGGGDDTVLIAASNATVDGGAGNDTVSLSGVRNGYTVIATSSGYSLVPHDDHSGTIAASNVESLRFTDASLTLAGNASVGHSYSGTAANDVIQGSSGDDILSGGAGDDTLNPRTGANM